MTVLTLRRLWRHRYNWVYTVGHGLYQVNAATLMGRTADRLLDRRDCEAKMMTKLIRIRHLFFVVLVLVGWKVHAAEPVLPGLELQRGPINGALVTSGGKRLVVYGDPTGTWSDVDRVLLTHARRDVVWAAQRLVDAGVPATAPSREQYWLEQPGEFWSKFETARFHDYAQQTTKVRGEPLKVRDWVKQGSEVRWQGLSFEVLETPGYTRGSATYLVTLANKKVAFTGDLIYGDGQLFDLYSLQDAIPEAQVRGYHGYAGRLGQLVNSLRELARRKPDLLVPARGPVIRDPQAAIERLIGRVQSVYGNYLSTNALHWYFKEDRMRTCGERVLGAGAKIDLMPYSRHETTPAWVFEQSTSRLLISKSKRGFLLDCGYQRVIDAVDDLIDKGIVTGVDGIFVTHFHDDHTDSVQAAAEHFKCPVYATQEYADILENPAAYHMPAMTSNAIQEVTAVPSGHTLEWHEFQLTFHFFPGQTIYHGALLAEKEGDRPIFFVGDAFAPSGMDDYCLLNRNLIHDDAGYFLCLKKVREHSRAWLVNEHITHVFDFSDDELNYLEQRYRERRSELAELFPWDDPNYGIDEQWAVFYPYGAAASAGEAVRLEVRLTNHSPRKRTFVVTPQLPPGVTVDQSRQEVVLESKSQGRAVFRVQLPQNGRERYVIRADIKSDQMEFRDWVEALISVK